MLKKLILLAIVLSCLSFLMFNHLSVRQGPLAEQKLLMVKKGMSLPAVAKMLHKNNVIDFWPVFYLKARLNGIDKKLRAGEYLFNPAISINETLEKIASGDVYYHSITLPEGMTTGKFLFLIQSEENLDGDITLMPKEGEMLPETYKFEKGASKDSLIKQAMDAMERVKKQAWDNRESSLPIKNAKEMMILASIIEKETALSSERAKVASVFVNRLKKGMRLQTDPTVIYAITEGIEDFGRSLRKKDLRIDSPYNTYRYYGLPPTPICNPSQASVEAAVHPENTEFLYFVANGKGGHNFAKTLKEHNQNVRNWLKK